MKKPLRRVPGDWEKERIAREWERSGTEKERQSHRADQERDRDRVLYCSALHRLASVTQVTAPESGYTFHNRLSHSLKVAQVGRRNAERLQRLADDRVIDGGAADLVRSVSPDAVEAACLAHDLGHPPFGHIAETVLQEKASPHVADGFEGNAQSFRIVTQLAIRDGEHVGLNLTRETLDYLLKYPWKHWPKDPMGGGGKRERKWGYYFGGDDEKSFRFARAGWPEEEKLKLPDRSLGAEIMDWADDLTYAVHDVDDFFRAGLVPLDRLRNPQDPEIKRLTALLTEVKDKDPDEFPAYEVDELVEVVRERLSESGPGEPYRHTNTARADLREFGSTLITRFLETFMVENSEGSVELTIDKDVVREVTALKMLVVVYVIQRPGLAVVQQGQQKLIGELFDFYFEASAPNKKGHHLLPPGAKERLEATDYSAANRARVVVDFISGLTENAAVQLHRRWCGWGTGPALDATALMG